MPEIVLSKPEKIVYPEYAKECGFEDDEQGIREFVNKACQLAFQLCTNVKEGKIPLIELDELDIGYYIPSLKEYQALSGLLSNFERQMLEPGDE